MKPDAIRRVLMSSKPIGFGFIPLQVSLIMALVCGFPVNCQQQRTGKSYDTGEKPSIPPPPGPVGISPVTFTDITLKSRIGFVQSASPTSQKYLPETMGGGVALFDYDNDGRLDLFFTNGALLHDPMTNQISPDKSSPLYWNRLYHQKSDGTFEDVTEHSGLKGNGYSFGVAAGDFDNDGYVDLYVTGYGGNHLYRNQGDGTFSDITSKAGVGGSGWSTSAGWFDYDHDGRLDLFVLRYLDWDFDLGSLFCGQPTARAYCHPDNFKPTSNLLYHQKPNGTFEDATIKAKISDTPGKGLGLAFADFDGDGFTDVFVANDNFKQSLFRNKRDGTFEDVALVSGAGYDEGGKAFSGMGVDAADFNNDGRPDVFITTLSNETYGLYQNNGEMSFDYVTHSSGVGRITLLNSGWGTRFFDMDNDGLRDIFVAQSHVLDTIEKSTSYLKYREPLLLMRNTGKGFVDVSATAGPAFKVALTARGAAFGDLDNDGQTDIVVAQINGPPVILRNNGTHNHWVGLRLIGTSSNRDGAGARVVVTESSGRRQTFDVSTSGSYLSSSDPRIIVGLRANAGPIKLNVKWPSGISQEFTIPATDRYVSITEPKAAK